MKVAVVGSGISGLGAAWLLAQKHDVHLFESEGRLGGHAHTANIQEGERTIPADTGFLVYNELTYPHLTAFFKALGVDTAASEMSLSIQVKDKKLEWCGTNLNSVFAQRRNLLNLRFHRMLYEIMRFHRQAEENLQLSRRHAWTLGELLRRRRYSDIFRGDYLLPMGAAIWSTPEKQMLDFPAATFLSFCLNHRLLQLNDRPLWRTVRNGSIQYVQKAAKAIPQVHLAAAVRSVRRDERGVWVNVHGQDERFDRVVMATPADITLKLLSEPSLAEREVLGAFHFEPNLAVLHADSGLMPTRARCWSSWNVLGTKGEQGHKVSLSYYLNRLQPMLTKRDYFVTLNPQQRIVGETREFNYSHPLFDQAAIRAQRELPSLQGNGGVFFAGAWSRYGFHEDGLLSAVRVAGLMGVETPWSLH